MENWNAMGLELRFLIQILDRNLSDWNGFLSGSSEAGFVNLKSSQSENSMNFFKFWGEF